MRHSATREAHHEDGRSVLLVAVVKTLRAAGVTPRRRGPSLQLEVRAVDAVGVQSSALAE
jgi:hypothetical protein